MANLKTISEVMKRHHYQLEGLLNRFQMSQDEAEAFPKMFNKFKWELEKHFFIEEKAIFTLIYSDDPEIHEMKDELLREHRAILKTLGKIENDLNNKIATDLTDFQNSIKKHRDFEDEAFYPTLDRELDNERKKEIWDRISNPM
ncbi:hemerythrin domain-containing protein [[Eubacterium] cellulosolvens]